MSSFAEKFARLAEAWEGGENAPADLIGQFTDDEGYRAQVQMLKRRLANGAVHAGWKIGQTNRKMREDRGEHQPAPGFLLASERHASGVALDLGGADDWNMEPELAVILGKPLNGPNVTPQDVAAAIDSVAPAIELVRPKKTWPDRTLLRAVNGATSGYIFGDVVKATVDAAGLDDMQVEVFLDGALHTSVRAGDVNDNPLETIAWLANYLSTLGETLPAGFFVMAGSYAGLVPMAAGQQWSATIGGYGKVEMSTLA